MPTLTIHTRRFAFRSAVAVLILAGATACADHETLSSPVPSLTTIDVTLESSLLEVGQFATVTASPLDQFATPFPAGKVTFTSSNTTVAVVGPATGKILAIAPGTAQIIATVDGRSGQRTITVEKAPAIRVNEVKSNGESPDGWVELYNASATTVDISGWTLTTGSPFQSVVVPPGTKIPSGGFLVIDEASLPEGFGSADSARLFSRYGVFVDGYSWQALPVTTFGRCGDGTGDFAVTTTPTKGAPNACPNTKAK